MQSLFLTKKTLRDISLIVLAGITSTLLIWLPHLWQISNFFGLHFSEGFNTIYRNYDGLEYVVIAKSFYLPELITQLPQSLPATYYASHFPGYALMIFLVAPVFGFLKSMLFVAVFFTIASAVAFYFLLKDFRLTSQPLFLSLLFYLLPARWLIVHSVGSAEPLFIFATIMAVYFFMKFERGGKYLDIFSAAIFGLLAQFTRPPGILLYLAFTIYLFWKTILQKPFPSVGQLLKIKLRYSPLLLIPLCLLAIFGWFNFAYGDFLAYFHSGDNIHLTLPPFQVFDKNQPWVGEIWLEDIVYVLLLGFLGGLLLLKQKLYPMGIFVLTYLVATTLVAHRDISRYALPIFPFCLIAFEKILTTREFKITLAIIAFAVYLYSQNFLLSNTAPIPNLINFN